MYTRMKFFLGATGLRLLYFSALAALMLSPVGGATAQHGGTDHLFGDGDFGNIELVSKEIVTSTPDLVADLAVNPAGTYAFLANWGEPDCAGPETGGQNTPDAGAWVIDISDLSDPKTVGFIPAHQDSAPGEGMQVVNITTKHFNGDVLVMNNEQCGPQGKGGVSLWDVTNPLKPFKLSEHFGDRGQISLGDANDIHSAFAWDAGAKAYVVMTDNFESSATDVDILDITNPSRPRLIREINLDAEFPSIRQDSSVPNLVEVFLHDMVVKKIGADFVLLLSYWDGGYVQLNVNDPANPTLIGDTDYADPDPELLESAKLSEPPEGNGHQAEFTADNQFFIGADEDFAAHNVETFTILSGDGAGTWPAGSFGWTVPIVELSDGVLNGPTVYGGYGCPDDVGSIPSPSVLTLAAGEEAILVLQRGPVGDPTHSQHGACFFSEKVEAAQNAGYDAVIIANHHTGAGFGAFPDATFCGGKGHDFVVTIPGVCLGHRAFHLLFNTTESYTYPDGPAIGPPLGADVMATGKFDGWGYVHLFRNTLSDGKFTELDTYAIDEAHDPAFAFGSGDLSVHEVATDPQDPKRAYLSYYAGGIRSLEIRCTGGGKKCQLVEVGGYLDSAGNDFWGVETFVRDGQTIILGSDRDSGLWIFRRTGP